MLSDGNHLRANFIIKGFNSNTENHQKNDGKPYCLQNNLDATCLKIILHESIYQPNNRD